MPNIFRTQTQSGTRTIYPEDNYVKVRAGIKHKLKISGFDEFVKNFEITHYDVLGSQEKQQRKGTVIFYGKIILDKEYRFEAKSTSGFHITMVFILDDEHTYEVTKQGLIEWKGRKYPSSGTFENTWGVSSYKGY